MTMAQLWLPLFLLTGFKCADSFVLEGSLKSFAQFPSWFPGANGSLQLEFLTKEPNGLLLYADDGGSFEFFELKLVEGSVHLRYNIGGGTRLMSVGRELNDGIWHSANITRNYEKTTLYVDGHGDSRTTKSLDYEFGSQATNSHAWVGGIPPQVSREAGSRLTLKVVILEPNFAGRIRNLVYRGVDGIPHGQDMLTSKGTRQDGHWVCDSRNPCLNGGRCISGEGSDHEASCECLHTEFEGTFCEKKRLPDEATFRGREHIGWDLRRLGGEPLAAQSDHISFAFKTRHPNGLLFFSGHGKDYVNIALKEGGIVVTLDMGGDPLGVTIRPDDVRFDDNQWHTLDVHRKVKEINAHTSFCILSVSVDQQYDQRRTTAGPFSQLESSRLHVGGADHPALLPGAKTRSNFVGCIRKVEYRADSVRLQLLSLAKLGHQFLRVTGRLSFMCQEVEAAEPVSFTTKESYLSLPSWDATKQGSIGLKIRTTEQDGLILYNSGADKGDFFALELIDGHLYLHLNLGSGSVKVKMTNRRVDDGLWHELSINREGRFGRATVDDVTHDFTTVGDSFQLDLVPPLYVGGVGLGVDVPPDVWSGRLKKGFVGCLRDLVVNGHAADLASYAKKQDSGSIMQFCHNEGGSCESSPCMHDGVCRQGWARFVCDCTSTSFMGPTCGKDSTTVTFNGSQYFHMLFEEEKSQAEDIIFRFLTSRPAGLLFIAGSMSSSDALELALDSGRLRVALKLGDREKVLSVGTDLNDSKWHIVRFRRRATSISLQVDNEIPVRDYILTREVTLVFRHLYIGLQPSDNETHWLSSKASITSLENPFPSSYTTQPFKGQIQSFFFNGDYLFEMARAGYLQNAKVTAEFGKEEMVTFHPVTFKSRTAFVALHQLKAYSTTNVFFQFKTHQPSGIIMYNGGRGHDFFAIELVNGHIHLIFNMGDGPIRIRDNNRTPLNDNNWHSVTIGRPSLRLHTLMVDYNTATITNSGANINMDLQGYLYLGGVPPEMYKNLPRQVVSRKGFQGCLASLDLNGETPDPAGPDALVKSNHVLTGCDGPSTRCQEDACSNGGTCVQQWNSYSCNCDMTSYTGPTCSDESTSYEFGPGTGLVTFQYPEGRWPDTHRDILALGIMTKQRNGTILRLDSANSNDFLELSIIDGEALVIYNMGTEDHPVGAGLSHISDGTYHVLKFVRTGQNASLQLDNYDIQSKNPTGHQLTVFNGQSTLQIGGKREKRSVSSVDAPFQGVLSGLVLNGEKPLDLAAERDPRVTVEGDVHLLMTLPKEVSGVSPPRRPQQSHAWQKTSALPGPSPGEGDDLIFSGGGAACEMDDEDQCVPEFDTGSGDDLITPVYLPPTRPPVQKKPQWSLRKPDSGVRPCDDEEDCYIGSGSGEFNVDEREDVRGGTGLEFGGTYDPMVKPDIIHSEENGVSRNDDFQKTTAPSVVTPRPWTTSKTTATTTRPRRTTTTSSTTTTKIPYVSISYDNNEEYGFGIDYTDFVPVHEREEPDKVKDTMDEEDGKQTALIISIVAGILIVVVLVILIVLKIQGRSNPRHKVDETKTYTSLDQGPTIVVNGQGSGTVKPGDRRPIKKQTKDVKEWYV